APGVLPLFPIDSEEFPLLIENVPDMYKVPGQNVYFVPYGSSPMGTHPVWTSPSSSPTYQPFPESHYYPGQQPQYFEAMDSSSHRLYVVPGAGYEHDSEDEEVRLRAYASDGDRRSRKVSRGFYGAQEAGGPAAYYAESSRIKAENRVSMRPPPSVSPANSAATDESGRSSSYSSSGSSAASFLTNSCSKDGSTEEETNYGVTMADTRRLLRSIPLIYVTTLMLEMYSKRRAPTSAWALCITLHKGQSFGLITPLKLVTIWFR
ncbi:7365_t:CDS:2, partial [Acaulospora colombiana]